MSQKPIELILARQLASYLAWPTFIVDPAGTLIFYNEPAERVLGLRFEETGEMPAVEWATRFTPTDDTGAPVPPEALPLSIALTRRTPAYGRLWIRGLDGVTKHIELTAFPLIDPAGRHLGGVALFWESVR